MLFCSVWLCLPPARPVLWLFSSGGCFVRRANAACFVLGGLVASPAVLNCYALLCSRPIVPLGKSSGPQMWLGWLCGMRVAHPRVRSCLGGQLSVIHAYIHTFIHSSLSISPAPPVAYVFLMFFLFVFFLLLKDSCDSPGGCPHYLG